MNKNNKVRVLLVSPLVSNVIGGIAKWTQNIYDYYSDIGSDQIELIPCYNKNIKNPLPEESLFQRLRKGITNYLPIIRQVKSSLIKEHLNVIHICTSASVGLVKDIVIANMAKKYNVKCIVHFHFGRIPIIFSKSCWEQKLIRWVIALSDKVIVMDLASYKTLQEQGCNKVEYIPNPLSAETQKVIKQNYGIKRIPRSVLFVGQMLETKGIYELAQACEQLDGVKVHFVGPVISEQVVTKLRSLINKDKIDICGAKPSNETIREMLSASVFVLPSYSEGFPNVIIESMACACPIVATTVGAIPEMLNIHTNTPCGICIPVKNVDKLRESLCYMLNNPFEAMQMGHAAAQRVQNEYSIQKVWSLLQRIWLFQS